jgi:membrane protease YdiL (CAAX protease family)
MPAAAISTSSSRPGPLLFAEWLCATCLAWTGVIAFGNGGSLERMLPDDPPAWISNAFWLGAEFVVWVLPMLWLARREARGMGTARWLTLSPPRGGVYALLGSGVWLALVAVAWPLQHGNWPEPTRFEGGVLQVVRVCFAGPLFEEMMFRGFGLRLLMDRGQRWWTAVLITSFGFGGLHVPGWLYHRHSLSQFVAEFVSVVLIGLFLGILQVRAKSLWAPCCVHVANNLWTEGVFAWLVHRL